VYTSIHDYSHREGEGELTREKVRGAIIYRAKNTNMTDSISSLETLLMTIKDDI
jgi:hypothetical protein